MLGITYADTLKDSEETKILALIVITCWVPILNIYIAYLFFKKLNLQEFFK